MSQLCIYASLLFLQDITIFFYHLKFIKAIETIIIENKIFVI